MVAKYVLATEGLGRFDFVAAGNWNDTEVEKVPTTNVISNICNGQPPGCTPPVLFDRVNTLAFEEGTPDSKISLGIDWGLLAGGVNWGVNLKGTRYGNVVEPGVPSPAEINAGIRTRATCTSSRTGWSTSRSRPNYSTTSCGWRSVPTTCSTSIRIACRTRGRCRIRRAASANLNTTNALGYSRYSPYGFNGRFLYARMSYRW